MANSGFHGNISPQDTWQALEARPHAVLLDVRSSAEWAFVGEPDLSTLNQTLLRIEWQIFPGMQPNPAFLEQFRAAGVDPTQPIYVVCRSGVRSRLAALLLAEQGYETWNVADGFEGQLSTQNHRGVGGWRAVGLPWKQS